MGRPQPPAARPAEAGPPRVLLVSHDFLEPGLARQLEALGRVCALEVAAPDRADVLVFGDIPARGRPPHTALYRRIRLFGAQYLLRSLDLGMRRWRPEVVHIHYDPWSAIFWQVRIAAALFARGATVVCSAKKNTYRRYGRVAGRLKAVLARAGLALCDHVMAASEMAAAMYRREFGLDASEISVATRIGIDPAVFAPAPARGEGPVAIGYCGRLAEHKGVTDLVGAVEAAMHRTDLPPLRLRLLGDGPLRERLGERARELDWLEVAGPVASDEVASFLRSLDLFVLAARALDDHEEHDGHALLQAMAAGLPAIATRSGIIPEILTPETGVLVHPAGSAELSDAIARLARDRAARERLGSAARVRAEARYSLDAVAAGYLATYRAALGDRPG